MKKFFLTLALIAPTVAWAAMNLPPTPAEQSYLSSKNKLKNPGFETGTTGSPWAKTGGTAVYEPGGPQANVGEGRQSFKFDASASSQSFCSELVSFDYGSSSCMAAISYKGGDANLNVSVVNGSAVTLTSQTLVAATSWTPVLLPFPCGTSAKVCVNSTANAAAVYLDKTYLGEATPFQVTGMAGSDDIPETGITFSAGFGTTANANFWARRVGDHVLVHGYVTDGTVAGSVASINLPSKWLIDSTKLGTGTNAQKVGNDFLARNSTAQNIYSLDNAYVVFYDGSDTSKLYVAVATGTTSKQFTKANGNALSPGSSIHSIDFDIPIAGWSSNVSISPSTTSKISSYLANGTRVTGSAPTALGEYRSYLRNAGAQTWTETSGTPSTLPTVADGVLISTVATYASADPSGAPSRYEIFVGKNKNVKTEYHLSAARTGFIDTSLATLSSYAIGLLENYDPASGVLTVAQNTLAGPTNLALGLSVAAAAQTSAYFDVTISDNALAVGYDGFARAELFFDTHAGYGGTATNRPYYANVTATMPGTLTYSNSSTNGLSVTIGKSGIYGMTVVHGTGTAGSDGTGITLNTSANSTIDGVVGSNRLCWAYKTGVATVQAILSCSAQRYLQIGDVIRITTAAHLTPSANDQDQFSITQIAN